MPGDSIFPTLQQNNMQRAADAGIQAPATTNVSIFANVSPIFARATGFTHAREMLKLQAAQLPVQVPPLSPNSLVSRAPASAPAPIPAFSVDQTMKSPISVTTSIKHKESPAQAHKIADSQKRLDECETKHAQTREAQAHIIQFLQDKTITSKDKEEENRELKLAVYAGRAWAARQSRKINDLTCQLAEAKSTKGMKFMRKRHEKQIHGLTARNNEPSSSRDGATANAPQEPAVNLVEKCAKLELENRDLIQRNVAQINNFLNCGDKFRAQLNKAVMEKDLAVMEKDLAVQKCAQLEAKMLGVTKQKNCMKTDFKNQLQAQRREIRDLRKEAEDAKNESNNERSKLYAVIASLHCDDHKAMAKGSTAVYEPPPKKRSNTGAKELSDYRSEALAGYICEQMESLALY